MGVYAAEKFTDEEADVLRPYFTNLDRPVFALVNLPEVVKGALFARYSRSHKSLRRLFLDEFVGDLDLTGDLTVDATVGLKRAEELYDRVFLEYGDDSVAQLGGVHLACEQASNLLTKILEWGRLMAYLEQSTRYIAYDSRLDGRYRYYRDPARARVAARHPLRRRPGRAVRHLRRAAAARCTSGPAERYPKEPGDSDFVYKQTIKAKACDAVRGVLPAATLSNVGIYGTGQAYEALLLRMRAHPLPEARSYADADARGAAQGHPVVPHPGRPARPRRARGATYLAETRHDDTADVAGRALRRRRAAETAPAGDAHRLRSRRRGQARSPPSATRTRTCPSARSLARVRELGDRRARRAARARTWGSGPTVATSPGRAFERIDYRFDVLADYGAFRDLQRHRMLTIEWQPLSPAPRVRPDPKRSTTPGLRRAFDDAMERSAALCTTRCSSASPQQAPYAVSLAYRMRFVMQMNAREAMHLIELRTAPQGHPAYRHVGPGDAPADRGARPATARSRRRCASSTTPPSQSSSASTPSAGPREARVHDLSSKKASVQVSAFGPGSAYDPARG